MTTELNQVEVGPRQNRVARWALVAGFVLAGLIGLSRADTSNMPDSLVNQATGLFVPKGLFTDGLPQAGAPGVDPLTFVGPQSPGN